MSMADENQVNDLSQDESKKDTVRINLPQGLGGKPPAIPTPTVRLKPAAVPGAAAGPVDTKKATAAITPPSMSPKAKKDTAALTPAAAVAAAPAAAAPAPAKTKKDTSRVQTTAAKPTVPEMPRPTVKLKREEPSAPALPPMAQQAAPAPEAAAGPATSMLDVGLSLAAMVVALAVAGYLFSLCRG